MQTNQSACVRAPAVDANITLTPEIHKDGDWYVAFCPEVPEANGQGRTPEESVQSLKDGVLSIMQDRRADAAKNGLRVPEPD
jgi:predicted RNase H-like HicB family nuclease